MFMFKYPRVLYWMPAYVFHLSYPILKAAAHISSLRPINTLFSQIPVYISAHRSPTNKRVMVHHAKTICPPAPTMRSAETRTRGSPDPVARGFIYPCCATSDTSATGCLFDQSGVADVPAFPRHDIHEFFFPKEGNTAVILVALLVCMM